MIYKVKIYVQIEYNIAFTIFSTDWNVLLFEVIYQINL